MAAAIGQIVKFRTYWLGPSSAAEETLATRHELRSREASSPTQVLRQRIGRARGNKGISSGSWFYLTHKFTGSIVQNRP